jgi:hypothetical protein
MRLDLQHKAAESTLVALAAGRGRFEPREALSCFTGNGPSCVGATTGMDPKSSPSITATRAGGFQVAFDASRADDVWTVGRGPGSIGAANAKLGVASGTNPGIARI